MHLINNIHLVFTNLRRDANLIDQIPDIIYRIIGSCIQFKNIESKIFIRSMGIILIDHFCKNTGASSFSYSAWTCKQQSLGQVIMLNGI